MDVPSWLIVTPARNERERLPKLAASLAAQEANLVALWVIVDDGSEDGTAAVIEPSTLPFPVEVHRRLNTGGLEGASDRAAFDEGVAVGLERFPTVGRIAKIDADIVLADDHLALLAGVPMQAGLVGGIMEDAGIRSHAHHVRGGLRAYSRAAWDIAREVPIALGWDVLDEVAIREAGMDVVVVRGARAWATRKTGSSEGEMRGRRRAGVVARWTGYHPLYFALRLLRYAPRRPVVAGSAAMLWSYVHAGPGPFSADLKRSNRAAQTDRLRALLRSPRSWLRENLRH